MSGYNLITLDAGKIPDNFTVEQLKNNHYCAKFEYDLSDKSSIRREIISSMDRYDDSALFYQIRQVVGSTDSEEENSLQQDFKTSKDYRILKKEDFNANPVYRLKWIFDEDNVGITLTFDGNFFYVTGTDARLSNTGWVRLNYQFLSTLDLSAEDFEVLTQRHIENIDNVPKFFLREYLSAEQSEDDDNVDNEQSAIQSEKNASNKCIKILSQNKEFIHDPKITSLIQEMQNTYKKNLYVGRFEVQGQQQYLSGDLLYFLIKIATKIDSVVENADSVQKLLKQCLYSDRFYMAISSESKFQLNFNLNITNSIHF